VGGWIRSEHHRGSKLGFRATAKSIPVPDGPPRHAKPDTPQTSGGGRRRGLGGEVRRGASDPSSCWVGIRFVVLGQEEHNAGRAGGRGRLGLAYRWCSPVTLGLKLKANSSIHENETIANDVVVQWMVEVALFSGFIEGFFGVMRMR
jgi:hypothetical protein